MYVISTESNASEYSEINDFNFILISSFKFFNAVFFQVLRLINLLINSEYSL